MNATVDCVPVAQPDGTWKCEVCGRVRRKKSVANCRPISPEARAAWQARVEARRAQFKYRLDHPCALRGRKVGEETCPTCRQPVRIHVFACPLFGRCVVEAPDEQITRYVRCVWCKEYREPSVIDGREHEVAG